MVGGYKKSDTLRGSGSKTLAIETYGDMQNYCARVKTVAYQR